jgi:hypothetical protein
MLMACLLSGCSRSVDPVASRIMQSIKKDGSIVWIADATDFEWDQLYVFPPYFLSKDIPKMVGASFCPNIQLPDISVNEQDCFFVFLKDNHVVCAFPLRRHDGDFSDLGIGPYFPETARFEVYCRGQDVYGKPLKFLRLFEPSL